MRQMLLSLVIFSLLVAPLNAQQAYYPLHVGDTWQYFQILFPDPDHPFVDVQQTMVTGDTLMPNGRHYSVVSGWWWINAFVRQVGDSVFRWTPYGEVLQFDFSRAAGDSILSTTGQQHDTVIVHTVSRDTVTTWGILSFKTPRRTWSFGLDNPLFVDDEQWIYVIDSLGIAITNAMIGQYEFKGARIDGRVYGNLTGVEQAVTMVPEDFLLEQNYPNPFNPSTTIRYALPQRSHVTLTVFNALGQQVSTLVNAEIDAGYREITFNAASLASGVYFYRLQVHSSDPAGGGTGNFTQTRKLCVIK